MQTLTALIRSFLYLGLTSFGGPVVHIARFEQTFVRQLGWLTPAQFQQLVAQAHLLPGPSSSQVGFAIGVHRAGIAGGITAFIAFTLPSALLMLLAAWQLSHLSGTGVQLLIHGLKLFAAVVVTDAVIAMARNFCRTGSGVLFAVLAAVLVFISLPIGLVIVLVMVMALLNNRIRGKGNNPVSRSENSVRPALPAAAFGWLLCWAALMAAALYWQDSLWGGFYTAGSSVFGGGHVVLPILQQTFASQLQPETLLTSYAAAQAVPGPLFTIAAFLRAQLSAAAPLTGALLATLAIFLPGFLLMLALMPLWQWLHTFSLVAAITSALNAAMVGVLASAALGVLHSSVIHYSDALLVVTGLGLMIWRRVNILLLMALMLAGVAAQRMVGF